jgi:hypothetical protein
LGRIFPNKRYESSCTASQTTTSEINVNIHKPARKIGSAFHIREGLEAYKMRRGVKTVTLPDFMNVIKVKPNKIEYLDTTLGNKNVKVKHVLEF